MIETIIDVVNIVTAVVTAASLIVAVTPTQKDDVALGKIKVYLMPILEALSLKVGYAKK
jgi:hypothetical protein